MTIQNVLSSFAEIPQVQVQCVLQDSRLTQLWAPVKSESSLHTCNMPWCDFDRLPILISVKSRSTGSKSHTKPEPIRVHMKSHSSICGIQGVEVWRAALRDLLAAASVVTLQLLSASWVLHHKSNFSFIASLDTTGHCFQVLWSHQTLLGLSWPPKHPGESSCAS